jgi:xanthine dehydrogenase accessory factor
MLNSPLIVVRGAGDIATGTICRLHKSGMRVLALEVATPTAIRRTVSLSEAVYSGSSCVEEVSAVLAGSLFSCESIWQKRQVPVLVDPDCHCLRVCTPVALVDAILAKKNCGTNMDMASITIGLGPGFTAGHDVHAVVETNRGHDLGRVMYKGSALANTGLAGNIAGVGRERVIYAPVSDGMRVSKDIGSVVGKGEIIARIGEEPVSAPIDGLVRGMIRDGFPVKQGMKVADIDPRSEQIANCYTISEKARCIAGGVLEVILHLSKARREGK